MFAHPPGPEWDAAQPFDQENFASNRNIGSGGQSIATWGTTQDSGYGSRARSSQVQNRVPDSSLGTDENSTMVNATTGWDSRGAKSKTGEVGGTRWEDASGTVGWGEVGDEATEVQPEIAEKQQDSGRRGNDFQDDNERVDQTRPEDSLNSNTVHSASQVRYREERQFLADSVFAANRHISSFAPKQRLVDARSSRPSPY